MPLLMFLEGGLDGLGTFLFGIMVGPAIVLTVIGIILRLIKNVRASKVFFILAGVYLLISFGVCGVLLSM